MSSLGCVYLAPLGISSDIFFSSGEMTDCGSLPFYLRSVIDGGWTRSIYIGQCSRTGQIVAVKKVGQKLGLDETWALERLGSHRNIIKLIDHCRDDQYFTYIVLEYVPETLESYVNRLKEVPLERQLSIGRQLARALAHCHRNSIIHRDVHLANVLISEIGEVKLADFGLACPLIKGKRESCDIGARVYRAPELLRGDDQWVMCLEPSMDMWSYGCVMAEVFCKDHEMDIVQSISCMEIWKCVTNESFLDTYRHLHPIIQRTLQVNPKDRATAEELLLDE